MKQQQRKIPEATHTIGVRIPISMRDSLHQLAQREGEAESVIVRRAIREWLLTTPAPREARSAIE